MDNVTVTFLSDIPLQVPPPQKKQTKKNLIHQNPTVNMVYFSCLMMQMRSAIGTTIKNIFKTPDSA